MSNDSDDFDPNEYAIRAIHDWVWSGFYAEAEVEEKSGYLVREEDCDEATVKAAIKTEFSRKCREELLWPAETDCDRLDRAFVALATQRIIAVQNAGYTLDEGFADVAEALASADRSRFFGYCLYHGQDVERAVNGQGLMLAFGVVSEDDSRKAEVGNKVRDVLQSFGFEVRWDGDAERRIEIPHIDWKRRLTTR